MIRKRSSDNSDMEMTRNEGNDLCIVCGKWEDDEVEMWVLCDQCNNWMPCVPLDHIYNVEDDDFVCHNCLIVFVYCFT